MLIVLALLFVGLLVLGSPIAFSMGLASVAALAIDGNVPLVIVAQRIATGSQNFAWLAIPLFILAGSLMDTGGITIRLVRLSQALVGWVRGGLGMVVVVGEIFFSGISGSSIADVSAIGAILIPPMVKAGYKKPYAVALVSGATAMGMLIPPCLLMVVLGVMTNLSIGALFMAGFIPGFVMALGLLGVIAVQARRGGISDTVHMTWRERGAALADSLLALMMPVIIFGGILGGVVTATEAAVLAVAYGFIIGVFVYREIKPHHLRKMLVDTAVTTGVVMLLVGTATVFSWILATQQVPQMLGQWMRSVSSDQWVFLLISLVVFLLFGTVLEGMPALIILIPILMPIAKSFGVDPLHYAILSIAAAGIALFSPPFGVGLFVACTIGKVEMTEVVRPFIPFLLVLVAALLVIAFVPWFTLVLPKMVGLY